MSFLIARSRRSRAGKKSQKEDVSAGSVETKLNQTMKKIKKVVDSDSD